jgi:2-polyprenyl-3-methyl-5-hydroxy-6-metoxy-1,4-benzoquinol methylase
MTAARQRTTPVTACPLCGASGARDFPIFYEFNRTRYQARECTDCAFVFLDPRLTPEDLRLLYSDEYFLHDGADCGAHSSTDYETAAVAGSIKFPEILGWIRTYRPTGTFFEIGCGMGYFLDYARRNGYTVSGVEYAAMGVRMCTEKFGLDVRQGSVEDLPAGSGPYDVVFLGDVLEHLVQPLEMLVKIRTMLKPGGIVAAEVPSMFNSLTGGIAVAVMRMLGMQKKMGMPPYHVNEFTPATLSEMLVRSGYGTQRIVQRIKPPSRITLRGSLGERMAKKLLQYPNYLLTRTFGIFGDRLLGIGVNDAAGDAQ